MARKTTRKKTTRRTTRKTASRTTTRKKVTKAAPAKKPARITTAAKTRSKAEVYSIIADHVGISKKEVAGVFDVMGQMIAKDLSPRGPGAFNVPGMMKVTVRKKPATKARKGTNPFTGEPMMFKAKPASKVVKVRPLKGLKDMV